MHRETDCLTERRRGREREKEREGERERGKRRFCDQCCKVDVKDKSTEQYLGVILFRLSENSFLMDEISENTFDEELTKLFLVKIQFRENYTRVSTTWRSKIQSEEIQNAHYSSRSVSLNLKDDNY